MNRLTGLFIVIGIGVMLSVGITNAQEAEEREGIIITVEGEHQLRELVAIVPQSWLAPEGSLPRYEIRFRTEEEFVMTCNYTGGGSISSYRLNVIATMVDLETGEQLGQRELRGTSVCPQRTTVTGYDTYGPPLPAALLQWLHDVTGSIVDLEELEGVFCARPVMVLSGHQRHATAASFSPDGRVIVTGDSRGAVYIWDAESGELINQIERLGIGEIERVAYSPDGQHILVAGDGVWVLNAATGDVIHELDSGVSADAEYSPDGSLIATAGFRSVPKIFDAESGSQLHIIMGETTSLVRFSPDGQTLLTGTRLWNLAKGSDSLVWDVENETLFLELEGPGGHDLSFSPDSQFLAGIGWIGPMNLGLLVWDVETGVLLDTFDVEVGEFIRYSPDGEMIIAWFLDYDFGTLSIFDPDTGRKICDIAAQSAPLTDANFSADGRFVVTASEDGTAIVWDLAELEITE